MVHRANVLLACSLIALGSAASACSDPEALGTSGSNLAMTLENGERYLDRIDGDRVVLFRTVNGRDLPFKDNEFPGKNIVIHPTTAKGDESLGHAAYEACTKAIAASALSNDAFWAKFGTPQAPKI